MFGDGCSRGSPSARMCTIRARGRHGLVLLACVLLLTGCRLDLAAEAVIDADRGGTVAVSARFDPSMLAELDALGVDPTAELEAAAASGPGWEVVRRLDDEDALVVTASRAVDDVAHIGEVFRELTTGLDEVDPALVVDIEVARDADGGTEVAGTAGLRPPSTAGVSVDGAPLGPDTQELAALVEAAVDARLQVRLPGRLITHDGDRVDDRTVVWELPAGEQVELRAVAAPAGWWATLNDRWVRRSAGAIAGLATLAAGVAVIGGLWWRRGHRPTGARRSP